MYNGAGKRSRGLRGPRGPEGIPGTAGAPGPKGDTGPAGGVTSIVAGTNVTISPSNGLGAVTINASGSGGGGGISAVTGSSGISAVTTSGTVALTNTGVRTIAAGIGSGVTFNNGSGAVTLGSNLFAGSGIALTPATSGSRLTVSGTTPAFFVGSIYTNNSTPIPLDSTTYKLFPTYGVLNWRNSKNIDVWPDPDGDLKLYKAGVYRATLSMDILYTAQTSAPTQCDAVYIGISMDGNDYADSTQVFMAPSGPGFGVWHIHYETLLGWNTDFTPIHLNYTINGVAQGGRQYSLANDDKCGSVVITATPW